MDLRCQNNATEALFLLAVNPTIKLFMEQLEMSADALEDYGISVVKVRKI